MAGDGAVEVVVQSQPGAAAGPGLVTAQFGVLVLVDLCGGAFCGVQRSSGRAAQPAGVDVSRLGDKSRLDRESFGLGQRVW